MNLLKVERVGTFDWNYEMCKLSLYVVCGEMCNKVLLLLAVTSLNQIKLKKSIKISEL